MMVIVEKLMEWRLAGGTEVLRENLPQRHFVHPKSHMTRPRLEPGLPQWEPWGGRHLDHLWSLPGDLNRKFQHMPYCSSITTAHPPMHPWKLQSLWLTTWLSFPSTLLVGLSPLWFRCFPNWKRNWRDDVLKQCLTSKGNRKWYSTSRGEMTSMALLKLGKNDGISIYVPKETYFERDGR
jgi:hypothetical protein